jgi:hypothetical protein
MATTRELVEIVTSQDTLLGAKTEQVEDFLCALHFKHVQVLD